MYSKDTLIKITVQVFFEKKALYRIISKALLNFITKKAMAILPS